MQREEQNITKEREQFEAEFEQALMEEQFVLYLLPKFHVNTDVVYGAEVLSRWNHPTRGLLEPKDFLPQCDAYGLMCKLDEYVWEHACQFLQQWGMEDYNPCTLSVKVSRGSLYNTKAAAHLLSLLNKYQVSKHLLQLEVEEDSIRADIYQAQEAINYLHEMGFTIILDDFSYGCSSISALNQIDVDILKVDMKFFSSSNNAGKGEVILASIIKSVNWLGMSVIAECVETKQQNDFSFASGCDYVQGFYFSKPLPAEIFDGTYLAGTCVKTQTRGLTKKENPNHNLSILVIDDSKMERELLYKYLKNDYHIQLCESAETGLAYLADHRHRVDLILLDYLMPGMNGIEFLQYCQLDSVLRDIPKIMITSSEGPSDQIHAFQSGAYDYLTKPLIPDLVRIRIQRVMQLNLKLRATEHEKIKFQHQAELDKATGIYNKITFQSYVEDYLAEHKSSKNVLMIIDIDNFKDVNDTHGHLMGDEVIKMIAARLTTEFRNTDYVGRFGGDEFTVFMIEVADKSTVEKKAEDVLRGIAEESSELLGVPVSVSIGMGCSQEAEQFDKLFERVDQALYEAKSTGKGKYIWVG